METKIKEILGSRPKTRIQDKRLKRAAVLVPIFTKDGEYYVLLTKRTDKVEHHKGQISFPGGRQDKKDKNLLATALREAEEEMGIKKKDVRILGELDDAFTVSSDFCITPFVAFIPHPYPFKINSQEIEEVLTVPFSAFEDQNRFRQELRIKDGKPLPVYFFQHEDHTIWGATARILKQLVELILPFHAHGGG